VNEKFFRSIFYYKRYYLDFFETLKPEVRQKFNWTFQLIATTNQVPQKYFKHMTGSSGIYEIRVEMGTDIYRVFSFFDKGQLIIIINGFSKEKPKDSCKGIKARRKTKKTIFR